MLIRPAQKADLPALLSIWQEQATVLAVMFPIRLESALPDWMAALDQALSDFHQQLYVAEESAVLLGFLWLVVESGSEGKVVAIGVEMHGQGSAVGAALWSQARDWFQLRSVRQVSIPRMSAIADAFWLAQGAVDCAGGLSIST